MSKSKGNVRTLDDLFAKYPPPLVRYFLLATHYRSPINFGDEPLNEVGTGYHRLVTFADLYKRVTGEDFFALPKAGSRSAPATGPSSDSLWSEVQQHKERFLEYMDDDFNTVVELPSSVNW